MTTYVMAASSKKTMGEQGDEGGGVVVVVERIGVAAVGVVVGSLKMGEEIKSGEGAERTRCWSQIVSRRERRKDKIGRRRS